MRKTIKSSQGLAVFDLRDYEQLLKTFLGSGYKVVSYVEARVRMECNQDRFAIWRHDIDFCLRRALKIARLENRIGVQSDYFVMVRSLMYNLLESQEITILEEILDLGHRIGLHFDANPYDSTDIKNLENLIERDCKILESCLGVPVPMVTFHRPLKSLLDLDISFCNRNHGYEADFFKKIAYFSDSKGTWSHGSPIENKRFVEGQPMQVLTHPIWWVGVAGETPTERLNKFSENRLDEIKRGIAINCTTYEYIPKNHQIKEIND